jgi:hypothetical protein
MQTVVKILIALEVPDDIAARQRFRQVAAALAPAFPADGEVRDFKLVEDGTGRLLEKWEGEKK